MSGNQGFYENILDSVHCSVCVYDHAGFILYCNQLFLTTYLPDTREYPGLSFRDIQDKKYQFISLMTEAQRTGESITRYSNDEEGSLYFVSVNTSSDVKGNRIYIESIFISQNGIKPDLKGFPVNQAAQGMVITDHAMKNILETITRISNFDSTILITGESGTGKSMLARYIHNSSRRSNEPFITINCATIPENLIESELFGYVSGAFTGAQNRGKPGVVELADKGTLFLDEIGLLPMNLQSKFLQLIQEKTYTPIGALKGKTVDIRIISATNLDLKTQIQEQRFREDLYYRLRVIEFYMPPLRERPDAVMPLIDHFMKALNQKYNIKKEISQEARELLKKHVWAGNIRELQYVIELLFVTSPENLITSSDIPPLSEAKKEGLPMELPEKVDFDKKMDSLERELLSRAFSELKSSYKVAEALGLSQTRASRLLRKHGIK